MLLISSCVCNFQRRLPDIERIHESDVRFRVKKELECYINFRNDFVKLLADNFSTWQISKEFDLEDIFRDNFTKDVMQMAECNIQFIQWICSTSQTPS